MIQTPGPMTLTPSSRVLTTGVTYKSLVAVERFGADGTLDTSFGYLGTVLTDVSRWNTTSGVAVTAAAIDPIETMLYVGGNGWLLRYRIHA